MLAECQEEIAATSTCRYYSEKYRGEELSYWKHIPKWLIEGSEGRRIGSCLDIGCAYGTLALYCKRLFLCDVYCVDVTEQYINKEVVNRRGLHFAKINVELEPLPWDLKFDLILFTEVLEHLNFHPLPTLTKIRDLLSPDGRMYLTTPNAAEWGRVTKYYAKIDDMPLPTPDRQFIDDHVYIYSLEELGRIIDDAGLRVEKIGYSPSVMNRRHYNLALAPK